MATAADVRGKAIREALVQNLEPDEQLRYAINVFHYTPLPVRVVTFFSPISGAFKGRGWYFGVTPKRVIFGRIKYPFSPDPSRIFVVQLGDVTVKPRRRDRYDLLVTNAKPGLPRTFRLLNGTDIDKLQAVLKVSETAPSPSRVAA